MTLPPEVQDLLKNPRRALKLAKEGSQKHILAIPATIDKFLAHLRPDALEILLLYCVKEEHNLEFADAIVVCIGSLEEDLLANARLSLKRHLNTSASSGTGTTVGRALEKLIIQYSGTIRKMMEFHNKMWFSKEGFGSSWASMVVDLHVGYLGLCLKVLASNGVIGRALFKDVNFMRISVRFWLATVLESKPGGINPVVHEALWACYRTGVFDQGDFLKLFVEEKDREAGDIATLFVSELRELTKKEAVPPTSGTDALIRLNLLLICGSNPIASLRRASFRLNAVSIITKAVLKLDRGGSRMCTGSPSFAFLTSVHDVLVERRDGVRWVADAIKAGLLAILAEPERSTLCNCLNEDSFKRLRIILHPFLTFHLVYYSVVRVAVDAMVTIGSERLEKLKTSPFVNSWTVFRSTLLERAVFMSRLDQKVPSPKRMLHCEYCLKDIPLRELKKCEECERTFYCSQACQKLDWRESDHKQRCMENISRNRDSAPMRTLDKFFMGHLACYDIRRHMTSISQKIQQDFAGVPLSELYLSIYYDTEEEAMSISVSPLSSERSAHSSRVRQQTKGQLFGPRLVEVHFYGRRRGAKDDSFYFILPQNYFGVPKLHESLVPDRVMARFRCKARYRSRVAGEDKSNDVPISDDPDEVGAILTFMSNREASAMPELFALTFNHTWKDIEKVSLECRRVWPFYYAGIL